MREFNFGFISILKANYPSSSFTYCLRRLVRGLSSDRSSARNGFYSALVTLLGQLPSEAPTATIVGEVKGFLQENAAKSTKGEVLSSCTRTTFRAFMG